VDICLPTRASQLHPPAAPRAHHRLYITLGIHRNLRLRAGTPLNESNGLYGLCCPGCTLSFPTCQGFSDCTLDHFTLAFSAVDSSISYRCWGPYQTLIAARILAAADLASLPVNSHAGLPSPFGSMGRTILPGGTIALSLPTDLAASAWPWGVSYLYRYF
jgi:hypothetical protein